VTVENGLARVLALVLAEPAEPGGAQGTMGLLQRLCTVAARIIPASGAGVSVLTDDGTRGVAVASDPVSERVDELQFTLGEGPCRAAHLSRRPVLEPDLTETGMARWPAYAAAAYAEGVRAVFAFPLQVGAAQLGALDLFRHHPGSLSGRELGDALMLADVATTLLIDAQQQVASGGVIAGLDGALDNRAVVHQAQGMVMIQLGISLADALARLRGHAFVHDRRLDEVARDIVDRRLRLEHNT
jgi:hypothetical protein